MNKQYDLIVYIGRFQPFHNAHKHIIDKALSMSDSTLVLVGSKNSPRTIKNPFTYIERKQMILGSFDHITLADMFAHRLIVAGIGDHTYDDNAWITEVGKTVNDILLDILPDISELKIAVIGHDKDHSSFYLNYFPQWDYISVPSFPNDSASIDATKIRELMFNQDFSFISGVVPSQVFDMLANIDVCESPFFMSDDYALLVKEYDFVKAYKKSWSVAPYEPTFITTDAVVIQSGHILLIKRGEFPGNGLWALPGGFVNHGERIRAGVLRELREETGLKVPSKVLDRAIDAYEMFDAPDRSTRGRTVTHTYRITLDPTQSLPKVKGQDDASEARWVPLSDISKMENVMFEDHYYMIKNILAQPARAVR